MNKEANDLILKHMRGVRGYIMKLVKDRELADEYLNDTVVRVLANFHSFKEGTNFGAWMSVIARNVVFSNWRKKKLFISLSEEEFKFYEENISTVKETQFDMIDIVDSIEKLVRPKDRELLVMASLGYEISELSEHFKVPEGTIKSRVHRIRRNMEPAINL